MSRNLAIALLMTMTADAAVKIEKTNYQGWPNSYRMTNGEIELVITSDIGPRIMRLGFVGGQNFFWEQPDALGKSGEPAWVGRGGHRVWVGPEDPKYTYPPDNGPVKVEVVRGDVLLATQPVEKETGVEKQIEVGMSPNGAEILVIHRLTNKGIMPLEFASWALSMMAPGGVGITGFPPRGTHEEFLAPTNPLVMWAYTDLSDPRWKYSTRYISLRQDRNATSPQKIGHFNPKTWAAYALNGELFIKRYDARPSMTYPDFGTSFQMFTNGSMLELETMGPLMKVAPGVTIQHVEHWSLHKNVKLTQFNDAEIDGLVLPLLQQR